MFTEDLSVFFDTNGFADVATFSDSGTANGILDLEYVETYNSTGYKPVFTCRTSDVSSYIQGAILTISGQQYLIEQKEQDGTGVTRVIMRELS